MKKNEIPQLNAIWWEKSKPKDLKKTNLGVVLKKYQMAKKVGDPKMMLKALAPIKKEVAATVKVCDPKTHVDTIAALKKYDKVITAELVIINKLAKDGGDEEAAQKVGPQIKFETIDISRMVKKYQSDWLVNFKDQKLELSLNADVMKLMNEKGKPGNIKALNADLKKVGDQTAKRVVILMLTVDKNCKGKDKVKDAKFIKNEHKGFRKDYRKLINTAQKDMKKIPTKYWKTFQANNPTYKGYKLKIAVNKVADTMKIVAEAADKAADAVVKGKKAYDKVDKAFSGKE